MPYQWTSDKGARPHDWQLLLWPHRSLPRRGFVAFIGATWAMLMLPLLVSLGSVVLWVLLPFLTGTLALTWYFLQRSYADGALTEELTLRSGRLTLIRTDPRGAVRNWHANPHWVRIVLHPTGGPVENYLTLTGGSREVELGAFLSAGERVALYRELADRLRRLDINAPEGR